MDEQVRAQLVEVAVEAVRHVFNDFDDLAPLYPSEVKAAAEAVIGALRITEFVGSLAGSRAEPVLIVDALRVLSLPPQKETA